MGISYTSPGATPLIRSLLKSHQIDRKMYLLRFSHKWGVFWNSRHKERSGQLMQRGCRNKKVESNGWSWKRYKNTTFFSSMTRERYCTKSLDKVLGAEGKHLKLTKDMPWKRIVLVTLKLDFRGTWLMQALMFGKHCLS